MTQAMGATNFSEPLMSVIVSVSMKKKPVGESRKRHQKFSCLRLEHSNKVAQLNFCRLQEVDLREYSNI